MLYVVMSSNDLFEMLQDDGASQLGKGDVSQLSKKNYVLGQMGNLEPHWTRFLQLLIS